MFLSFSSPLSILGLLGPTCPDLRGLRPLYFLISTSKLNWKSRPCSHDIKVNFHISARHWKYASASNKSSFQKNSEKPHSNDFQKNEGQWLNAWYCKWHHTKDSNMGLRHSSCAGFANTILASQNKSPSRLQSLRLMFHQLFDRIRDEHHSFRFLPDLDKILCLLQAKSYFADRWHLNVHIVSQLC